MIRLNESMQSLKEAIQLQENQLATSDRCKDFLDNKSVVIVEHLKKDKPHKSSQKQHIDEEFQFNLGTNLMCTESEISQSSHWSCSLDTINTSVGEVKTALRNQDKNIIRLMTDNEELKNNLKKREKELRKHKLLLRAERENFEQYKKDMLKEGRQLNSEEYQDLGPDKTNLEMLKLKSELAHYRQMYIEQSHTLNRLSKLVSGLKSDKTQLKQKLLQQEKRSNKFILDMAQRFEASRKEMCVAVSKNYESVHISPTNAYVARVVERNSRLSWDNTMLKLEVNALKQQLFQMKAEDGNLFCLTSRMASYNGDHYNKSSDEKTVSLSTIPLVENVKSSKEEKLKKGVSETSVLTIASNGDTKYVKTKVSNFMKRNVNITRQHVLGKETRMVEWDHVTKFTDDFEDKRVSSAPQLNIAKSIQS